MKCTICTFVPAQKNWKFIQQNNLQHHFCFLYLAKYLMLLNSHKIYKKLINSRLPNWSTEGQFASFQSSEFITAIVLVDPPVRNLAKCTSVRSFPAQIWDYVRIFQNTKPLPMIGEEIVFQSINLVEKLNCKIKQQKILIRNFKLWK